MSEYTTAGSASGELGKHLPIISLDRMNVRNISCPPVLDAPKIRPMESPDRLGPSCGRAFAGGGGYLGFAGRMDCWIAIRSLVAEESAVHVQAHALSDAIPMAEAIR